MYKQPHHLGGNKLLPGQILVLSGVNKLREGKVVILDYLNKLEEQTKGMKHVGVSPYLS
jgi:cobyric acid synthase